MKIHLSDKMAMSRTTSYHESNNMESSTRLSCNNDSDLDSGLGTTSSPRLSPDFDGSLPPWSPVILKDEPIAIVGMACRFAQANSPSSLWEMISSGRSGCSVIPSRSWNAKAWYHPSRKRAGQICATSGHFLDDIAAFDAPFFSMSSSEAAAMDPMQRLGLEIAFEAFENAGIPMERLAKSPTAVYSGAMTNDYQMLAESDPYWLGSNSAAGTGKSMLSNRISWFFDLQGPSLTIDTACSSSLYALHLASQAIRAGECHQALVTGHNLILNPTFFSQLSEMHMVSPDGISHSFDVLANGYGRGEGIAGIVVKRLSLAVAEGDVIRAVIRATGVNADGKTPGITVPSEEAQADLIRKVYGDAGLDMAETAYFEAHGTGTRKGDPIEARAIAATIGDARLSRAQTPVYVGTIKPNIGHTEGCAGLSGVIKSVLCLEAGVITSVAGLHDINPDLGVDECKVRFPKTNIEWPSQGLRRASINSFGFGGANAHVVLDDARNYLEAHRLNGNHITRPFGGAPTISDERVDHHRSSGSPLVIPLSSPESQGLHRLSSSLLAFLQRYQMADLESLAHIFANRRTRHLFRASVVATSQEELISKLSRHDQKNQQLPVIKSSRRRRLIFCFTGQGAQRPGMAKELIGNSSVFRKSITLSQKYLQKIGCSWGLVEVLENGDADTIADAEYSQPACTAVQIALVQLLRDWGVFPAAVVGHSSGEMVAAYAAGAVSHEETMRVAYFRGILSKQVSHRVGRRGAMLAVGLSETACQSFLSEHDYSSITIACINSPQSVTLSGESITIGHLEKSLQAEGYFARPLRTGGVAYHSPDMNSVGDDFVDAIGPLKTRNSKLVVPMWSSVTENRIKNASELDADYWRLNMTSPVRFSGAMRKLLSEISAEDAAASGSQHTITLEIGPSRTLAGPIGQIIAGISESKVNGDLPYLSMLSAGEDAQYTSLAAVGMLWSLGQPVDLERANNISSRRRRLPLKELPVLPTYPWNHSKSYWHNAPTTSACLRTLETSRSDLLGIPMQPQNPFEPAWHNVIRLHELPWLADHSICGTVLFPAAGYLVMAGEAVKSLAKKRCYQLGGIELLDVTFENSLVIGDGTGVDGDISNGQAVRLTLIPDLNEPWAFRFAIYNCSDIPEKWRRLAQGTVVGVRSGQQRTDDPVDFEASSRDSEWNDQKRHHIHNISRSSPMLVDVNKFYSGLADVGLEYGKSFRGLDKIRCQDRVKKGIDIGAYGELVVPDTCSRMPEAYESDYSTHPATLDGMFQLVFAALHAGPSWKMQQAAIPVSLKRAFLSCELPQTKGLRLSGAATASYLSKGSRSTVKGNVTFGDELLLSPAVFVEDIVLRCLPSTPNMSLRPSQHTKNFIQEDDSRITAEIIWKEDIEQSFALWKNCFTSESTIFDRCALFIDRYCHKRAHSTALFLGNGTMFENLSAKFAQAAQPSRPGVFHRCANYKTIERWRESESHGSRPQNEKYDLIVISGELLRSNQEASESIFIGSDLLEDFLKKTGAVGAWLIIADGDDARVPFIARKLPKISNPSPVNYVYFSGGRTEAALSSRGSGAFETHSEEHKRPSETTSPKISHAELVLLGRESESMATEAQSDFKTILLTQLKSLGLPVTCVSLKDAVGNSAQMRGRLVISLIEFERPFVYGWSESDLDYFRRLVNVASRILWITAGNFLRPHTEESVFYAPTIGLLRTLRAEYPDLKLCSLDLCPDTILARPHAAVDAVLEALRLGPSKSFNDSLPEWSTENVRESEFVEKNGRLLIPRLATHSQADKEIAHRTSASGHSELVPITRDSYRKGQSKQDQGPQLWLNLADDDVRGYWVIPDDGESRKEVAAGATALIRTQSVLIQADLPLEAMENSSFVLPLVQHTVGVVCDLDQPDMLGAGIKVGDAVLSTSLCAIQAATAAHEVCKLIRLPNCISKSSAAAVYWLGSLSAAHYVLCNVGHTSKGYSIVIDVGKDLRLQKALEIVASRLGARQVFLVGEVASSDSSAFEDTVVRHIPYLGQAAMRFLRAITGGVNLVLSTQVSLWKLDQLKQTLSTHGRIIHLLRNAKPENDTKEVPDIADCHEMRTFNLLDWTALSSSQAAARPNALETILSWIEEGRILLPEPLRQFSATDPQDLAKAITSTMLGKHEEALDVAIHLPLADDILIHYPKPESSLRPEVSDVLDPRGTYVISGGLGALGLPLARMLCDLGARHLVLLSRTGEPSSSDALTELESLRTSECDVEVVACDITSIDDIKHLAYKLNRRPNLRLKGIIQSAMVLADSVFANMSMEKWQKATMPKMHGSWNLHNLPRYISETKLATDQNATMDFFILLSSISGVIGNTAQSNYAAGNTFEDMLAHHRRANGLPAVSLNIGLVSDSSHYGRGAMSGFKDINDYLGVFGHLAPVTVSMAQALASVRMVVTESCARSGSKANTWTPAQLIVGISSRIQRSAELLNKWPFDRKFDHRTVPVSVIESKIEGLKQSEGAQKRLASVTDSTAGRLVVEEMLKQKLAQAMSLEVDSIDEEKSLVGYGLDSLKATELRNWINREFRSEISIFELLAPESIAKLSFKVLKGSRLIDKEKLGL